MAFAGLEQDHVYGKEYQTSVFHQSLERSYRPPTPFGMDGAMCVGDTVYFSGGFEHRTVRSIYELVGEKTASAFVSIDNLFERHDLRLYDSLLAHLRITGWFGFADRSLCISCSKLSGLFTNSNGQHSRLNYSSLTLSKAPVCGDVSRLVVNSSGGLVYAAFPLYGLVDKRKLTVEVPSGALCASACSTMLLFSEHIEVADDSVIHFHDAHINGEAIERGESGAADILYALDNKFQFIKKGIELHGEFYLSGQDFKRLLGQN